MVNLAVTDFLVLLLLMAASSSTFSLLLASTSSASFSSFAPSAASADSVSLLSQIKMMSMKGGSLGVEELWTEWVLFSLIEVKSMNHKKKLNSPFFFLNGLFLVIFFWGIFNKYKKFKQNQNFLPASRFPFDFPSKIFELMRYNFLFPINNLIWRARPLQSYENAKL